MNKLKSILIISCIIMLSCKSQNLEDGLYADIETNKGNIVVQLTYEDTPITVANFVSLAEGTNDYVSENFKGKKFYDGLTFHRVMKNFMIQGGDPLANGTGGPGYKFEDEFVMMADSSGYKLKHDGPGVLSMANGGPNMNGSQFFITHKDTPWLDGVHSIFGHVITGQNVVDSIAQMDTILRVKIQRVGGKAKKFKAAKIFNGYFKELEKKAKVELERVAKIKSNFVKDFETQKNDAEELSSGLKLHFLKKGTGAKPKNGTKVKVYYTGFFADGNLIDSNDMDIAKKYNVYNAQREAQRGYEPTLMDYDPASTSMIPGFKEALLKMVTGDKVTVFIPSHLAWGAQGRGHVPPNTDVIFHLEIVE